MARFNRRRKWLIALIICMIAAQYSLVMAGDRVDLVSHGPNGVAIKGYDTVAYFTEGKAVKGKPEYAFSWHDAQWHFANKSNRDLFAADPDHYAPQFGGFCSNGLSKGVVAAADPEQWTIMDGKLYIKYNRHTRDEWRQNKVSMVNKANKNWQDYLHGKPLKVLGKQ